MINAEGEGIPALLASDRKNKDGIVIFVAPKWNLAGITPIPSNQQLRQSFKFTVLPGYENQRVLVIDFPEFYSQIINLSVAKLGVNRKFTANGSGFDRNQRANVVEIATIRPFARVRLGGDLEFADEMTLKQALEGRREYR